MAEFSTPEELRANLKEYREQLEQVQDVLLSDPDNAEMDEMYTSLLEVIQLTEDLLKESDEQQAAAAAAHAAAQAAVSTSAGADAAPAAPYVAPTPRIITPPQLQLPSILPASVAEQIRRAQTQAALRGQAPPAWAIGAKCQAMYSDGEYYDATITAVSLSGNFIVVYDGYSNEEEVEPSKVREPTDSKEVYRGVAAPKRKRVEEEPTVEEIPKWLAIKESDDPKTRERKKKLLKSYKSKIRFQNMDKAQKEKQSNWQSFLKGKGTKKKAGFFTGAKKESMFSVPDNGKVGVIGSGKGMTDYKKRQRHEFDIDNE